MITSVLAILMYVVWLDTFTWRDEDCSHTFGKLSSALVVAAAIHEELGSDADGRCDEELKRALKAQGAGIRPRRLCEIMGEETKISTSVHVTSIAPEDCPLPWSGRGA